MSDVELVDVSDLPRDETNKVINEGKNVVFYTSNLDENTEKLMDFIIACILSKYGKDHFQATIYSSLKELVINGTKANAKRIFFKEIDFNIDDPAQYDDGMKQMKEKISESFFDEYGAKAKEAGFQVDVQFIHDDTGMRVEVINNTVIVPQDESRIREKLHAGMQYEDLVAFYMDNADNTEGEGMGLVMIILMLKGENIDPGNFRIEAYEDKTAARLEIPFNENYVNMRDRLGLKK